MSRATTTRSPTAACREAGDPAVTLVPTRTAPATRATWAVTATFTSWIFRQHYGDRREHAGFRLGAVLADPTNTDYGPYLHASNGPLSSYASQGSDNVLYGWLLSNGGFDWSYQLRN